MIPVAVAAPPRAPELARLRKHVLTCASGDPKTCRFCFDLERDASAEAWRMYGGAE